MSNDDESSAGLSPTRIIKMVIGGASDISTTGEPWQTGEERWSELMSVRNYYMIFCAIGFALLIAHILLLVPNIFIGCRMEEPIILKHSKHWYFKNLFKFQVLLLLFGSLAFDIPIGILTIEMVYVVWNTGVSEEALLTNAEATEASKLLFTLSLVGLALMAMYKGLKCCVCLNSF